MKSCSLLLAALLGLVAVSSAHPTSSLSSRKNKSPYIFSTFTSKNEQKDNEKTSLDIYTSDDGINFANLGKDLYTPEEGLVRDPSIMFRDGKYWITHTMGWTGDKIGVITSEDLMTWEHVTTIEVASDGLEVTKTWAPEFFVDPADDSVNIIVSILEPYIGNPGLLSQAPKEPFAPYLLNATSDDLTSWSKPWKMDVPNKVNQDHIDMFIFHVDDDGKYHAMMKNEAEKHIEHLTADSPTGAWEFVQTGDFAGWGQMEGPAVTRLPDDGDWIVWGDNYEGTVYYMTSPDLEEWSDPIEMPTHAHVFRHGTVIKQE